MIRRSSFFGILLTLVDEKKAENWYKGVNAHKSSNYVRRELNTCNAAPIANNHEVFLKSLTLWSDVGFALPTIDLNRYLRLSFGMGEKESSDAHKVVLAVLDRLKSEEENHKKKKKQPSIRKEKRLQYYSGWSPKV